MIMSIRSAIVSRLMPAFIAIALVCRLALAADSVPLGKLAVVDLDPAHTTIAYSLDGWPHHTQGTFALKRGQIRIDPQTDKIDGSITVDATSGNSGHSVRDERMKSSVLEVDRFPEITFVPQQVISHGSPEGGFPAVVRGLMWLHGARHSFTVPAVIRRDGDRVTIQSEFAIPFVAWGLTDPSILMFTVAKVVQVDVKASGRLSWIRAKPVSALRNASQ